MRSIIEAAWENRALLQEKETIETINKVIEDLDKGILRVAEPTNNGEWQVNEWVKKAVVMYFPIKKFVIGRRRCNNITFNITKITSSPRIACNI